ncbi:hypothetical protein [Xylophilus sp. GOD-11R]|uniref:hypothetical protein n=1 Tax=Xylophilus sp. GOD-11R TaxID=3089814 RepID=UPI00298C138C|nr:hypothetical protein [Xylophilus sp. GOD-11R]WPB56149.1 hypothetical protein R9X41_18670 [Xylophilus sp. GOD-11R]
MPATSPRPRDDRSLSSASADVDPATNTDAPTTATITADAISLTHLPDELLVMIFERLDDASLLGFGPVDRRTLRLARVAAEPVISRLLAPQRREADAMLAWLDLPVATALARTERAADGLDLLARIHRRHGQLLGRHHAMPQRWELMRRLLAEVERLAERGVLDDMRLPALRTSPQIPRLIRAVQALLEGTPALLRVRGDPELPDSPHLPVTRRLQAACRAIIRNCIQVPDTKSKRMGTLRTLTSQLALHPDEAMAHDNLCFIASLWRFVPGALAMSFVQHLQRCLLPFPIATREAVAVELQNAGRLKRVDKRKTDAQKGVHLSEKQREQMHAAHAEKIEQATREAVARVLTPGSGG